MKRNMSSLIAYMTLLLLLASCSKDVDINKLKQQKIFFTKLPRSVKIAFFKEQEEDFLELNVPHRYNFYIEQKLFLPWVYNTILVTPRGKKIKISRPYDGSERGGRYIVFGDSLYIANHYNIYLHDSVNYSFTKFLLK